MSKKYQFTIQIIELNYDAIERKNNDIVVEVRERNFEMIKVFVDNVSSAGLMELKLNRYIKLPSNTTLWQNTNEGQGRIKIEYVPTEATETLIYDQSLDL